MSKVRKGCRGRVVMKLVRFPLQAVTRLFVRMLRHMAKSFVHNVVWLVTLMLTLVIVVKNLFINVAKQMNLSCITNAVTKFTDGLQRGKDHAIQAIREAPGVVRTPCLKSIQHWFMALMSPVQGFFEMCATPVKGLADSISSHAVDFVKRIWCDYTRLVEAEVKFRDKVKSEFQTASNKVNSFGVESKDKIVSVMENMYARLTEAGTFVMEGVVNFFTVFLRRASVAKENAAEKAAVIAIKLKDVSDTVYIKARDVNDTVRLGSYYIIEEGKKGFPSSRRRLVQGTLQIRDGIISNVQRAKLSLDDIRGYRSLSDSICRRMDKIQNASALDGVVVVGTVSLIGYFIYLIFDKQQRETYHRSLKIHCPIRDACKDMVLQEPTLRKCMESLNNQMVLGLDPKTRDKSSVKCFNTYVQDLPTGQESGQFLALDLGGTNFRVLLITLNGRHFDMQSKRYEVPQHVMTGTGEQLFDHIASCLESFVRERRISEKCLPLGFTFSFPLEQIGLTKGILQKWTKGFDCSDVVGHDVVELLQIAIKKKNINIDVLAVLNDTTGTLMSCAWKNHNCKIGVILGTGTNACYAEKVENVKGFESESDNSLVLINTEWGAFGDNGELDFIRTPYDKEIDSSSINPGKQIHEKMISGMYLGELVRLFLVKFGKENTIFSGELSAKIQEKGSFPTEFVSEIESDKRGTFKNCRKVLGKLQMFNVTDQDCANVRYVCECVSRRAAHLASAGIATLINKMGLQSVTVGVDGSLYRYHPYFHDLMMEKISQLVSPSIHAFSLMLSDGVERGAALVAAIASQSENTTNMPVV